MVDVIVMPHLGLREGFHLIKVSLCQSHCEDCEDIEESVKGKDIGCLAERNETSFLPWALVQHNSLVECGGSHRKCPRAKNDNGLSSRVFTSPLTCLGATRLYFITLTSLHAANHVQKPVLTTITMCQKC